MLSSQEQPRRLVTSNPVRQEDPSSHRPRVAYTTSGYTIVLYVTAGYTSCDYIIAGYTVAIKPAPPWPYRTRRTCALTHTRTQAHSQASAPPLNQAKTFRFVRVCASARVCTRAQAIDRGGGGGRGKIRRTVIIREMSGCSKDCIRYRHDGQHHRVSGCVCCYSLRPF